MNETHLEQLGHAMTHDDVYIHRHHNYVLKTVWSRGGLVERPHYTSDVTFSHGIHQFHVCGFNTTTESIQVC